MQPNNMVPPGYQMPMTPLPKQSSIKSILSIVILALLFLGALTFGIWAFMSRQDYKNNGDQKSAAAVKVAEQKLSDQKAKEFAEQEKSPYKTYTAPSDFGAVKITYPKTWSAYVVESAKSSTPVDGYFHPDFVPDIGGSTKFALRLEVVNQTYDQVLKQYDAKAKAGTVKVAPYKAANVNNALGSRIDGEIGNGQKGSMVLFKIRDKTLEIYTESDQFVNDFNNIILTKLIFEP